MEKISKSTNGQTESYLLAQLAMERSELFGLTVSVRGVARSYLAEVRTQMRNIVLNCLL